MNEIINSKKCTGCAACANACPEKCIYMLPDNEGFLHPQIDNTQCINCSKCISVCPVQPSAVSGFEYKPDAFAAYASDDCIVEHSSSGGVFSIIAEYVIHMGGVVFGAAFESPDFVRHIPIRDVLSLHRLQGSKYVQSEIGNTYQEVEKELQQGNYVLFSGTPCQVVGLRHYLRKEYRKLICVDIICHSVPSPKVWRMFVEETALRKRMKIAAVNFRDKRNNWENYCLSFQLENGQEYILSGDKNLYMQAFIGGLSTRPSCSQCTFKGKNRESDITLGDYWGVRVVQKEAYNARGTSLVIVNTQKGKTVLNQLRSQLMFRPASMDIALPPNPAYSRSSIPHPRRARFFAELDSMGVYHSIEALLPPTKKERLILSVRHSLLYRAVAKITRLITRK